MSFLPWGSSMADSPLVLYARHHFDFFRLLSSARSLYPGPNMAGGPPWTGRIPPCFQVLHQLHARASQALSLINYKSADPSLGWSPGEAFLRRPAPNINVLPQHGNKPPRGWSGGTYIFITQFYCGLSLTASRDTVYNSNTELRGRPNGNILQISLNYLPPNKTKLV